MTPGCKRCGTAFQLYAPVSTDTRYDTREVWKHWCPRTGHEEFQRGDGSMTKERSYAEAGVDLVAQAAKWR